MSDHWNCFAGMHPHILIPTATVARMPKTAVTIGVTMVSSRTSPPQRFMVAFFAAIEMEERILAERQRVQ